MIRTYTYTSTVHIETLNKETTTMCARLRGTNSSEFYVTPIPRWLSVYMLYVKQFAEVSKFIFKLQYVIRKYTYGHDVAQTFHVDNGYFTPQTLVKFIVFSCGHCKPRVRFNRTVREFVLLQGYFIGLVDSQTVSNV